MCTKPTRRGQPYCYAHYMKKWRYGTPTPKHQEFREDLAGRRFDELLVTGYAGSGYWACMCDCGAGITRRAGELNRIHEKGFRATCGNRTVHQRQEWVDYSGAHCRVRADRGSARNYQCVDCGDSAAEWSYDNKDPDEFIATGKAGHNCAYSLKPEHYEPRCSRCHRRFDREHRQKVPCKAIDCNSTKIRGHGYCNAHYLRWKRHGDPLAGRKSPARSLVSL